jgi:hypothetical protein
MAQGNNNVRKVDWLLVIIIFFIGILVASNVFLFLNQMNLNSEIGKIKSDEIAIAQAINNFAAQVTASKASVTTPTK